MTGFLQSRLLPTMELVTHLSQSHHRLKAERESSRSQMMAMRAAKSRTTFVHPKELSQVLLLSNWSKRGLPQASSAPPPTQRLMMRIILYPPRRQRLFRVPRAPHLQVQRPTAKVESEVDQSKIMRARSAATPAKAGRNSRNSLLRSTRRWRELQ
jgi:hypothetical protein